MIEGFKAQLKSEEVQSHLRERVDYHSRQAGLLEGKLTALREKLNTPDAKERLKQAVSVLADVEGEEAEEMAEGIGMRLAPDPFNAGHQVQQRIENHKEVSAYFLFLADHVVPKDVYLLTREELFELEFLGKSVEDEALGRGYRSKKAGLLYKRAH